MKTTALKTPLIHPNHDLLAEILVILEKLSPAELENSVLAVTSKVVSLAENNVVPLNQIDKKKLIHQEADRYISDHESKYGVTLTIKNSILAVSAGIDESNVDGAYVLLPTDPYDSAARIWQMVKAKFNLTNFGVLITDSTTVPLKWGVVGRALAHCGFEALKDLRGEPDLFGRELKITQINIAEGIAAAAVLEMGEGADSTPLCLVQNIPHITFTDHPPTTEEIANLLIEPEDDVYAPVLMSARWQSKK